MTTCFPLAVLTVFAAFTALSAFAAPLATDGTARSEMILLKGGTVYDGTGAPGILADVLVEAGVVKAIGQDLDAGDAEVIDASGLVVCPGFIDVHNHTHENIGVCDCDWSREVISSVGQGVTTVIVGMDGGGELDIARYREKIESHPRSVNIGRLVGHTAARYAVLVGKKRDRHGERAEMPKREVTPEEISKMAAIVEQAMKDGAFGLSSGIEYLGDYVTTEEVIALAREVAPYGGYYETHLRNEDVTVFEATEEAVRICREAGNIPLSISHVKVGSSEVWHQAGRLLDIMEKARAEGIDVYANWRSSIQWSSNLRSFDTKEGRDLNKLAEEIRKYYSEAEAYCWSYAGQDDFVGKSLKEIADMRNLTPAETLGMMLDWGDARFEYNAMTWEDKKTFLMDPYCMVSSDGADGRDSRRRDPQIWSCFPIFFEKMVREWQWLGMELAVYKCTGLPAKMLGFTDRGALKPGMKADVVVFDPATIWGEEHWDKANTPPEGIEWVIVNGEVVMDHGKHTGAFPGEFLSKR